MSYETFEVKVPEGKLRCGMWGTKGPVVLMAHGITANHQTFGFLAELLEQDMRLIAPDLRGRGRSQIPEGPWGMQGHADDLVAILDYLEIPKADIALGQSMGGFVVAVAAASYPERFGSVLLADGGLPVMDKLPWYLPISLALRISLGPAMKRLKMQFESRQSYLDYWRKHPSLKDSWHPKIESYLDYDLVGEAPALRSSTSLDAVINDMKSLVDTDLLPRSLSSIRLPVHLLRAPRGLMNGKPLYKDKTVELWRNRIPDFSCETVADVNHYTLLMSRHGAEATKRAIEQMLTDMAV